MLLRKSGEPGRVVKHIAWLVLAAWAGEQSCIAFYAFYAYGDGWWIKLGHVPILVPLIWPMVILSARAVARELWPGATRGKMAFQLALIVIFDASLIEILAVKAGYWSWFEGGYFGVPLMGILGWGCFAFMASFSLDARGWRAWLAPATTLVGTHLLLLGLWWGGLRWTLRGDLGPLVLLAFGAGALIYAAAVWQVRRTRRLTQETLVGRLVATGLFLGLLVSLEHAGYWWTHFGLVAIPYVLAFPFSRSPTPTTHAR